MMEELLVEELMVIVTLDWDVCFAGIVGLKIKSLHVRENGS